MPSRPQDATARFPTCLHFTLFQEGRRHQLRPSPWQCHRGARSHGEWCHYCRGWSGGLGRGETLAGPVSSRSIMGRGPSALPRHHLAVPKGCSGSLNSEPLTHWVDRTPFLPPLPPPRRPQDASHAHPRRWAPNLSAAEQDPRRLPAPGPSDSPGNRTDSPLEILCA